MPNQNEARVVRVTNIFDFDYTHAYGGVPYQLRAGETLLFPFAIGDHLATHLARQAIIRKAPARDDNAEDGRGGESKRSDRQLWDTTAIDALKSRIMKDAYVEDRPAVETEAEMYARKIKELNQQFPDLTSKTPEPATPAETPSVSEKAEYKDKADVIAALTEKGIAHNPRSSKATLETLLK